MDTKQNAPQGRGTKVIRISGNRQAHCKPSDRQGSLQAYRIALARAEADHTMVNLLRWKDALDALPGDTLQGRTL